MVLVLVLVFGVGVEGFITGVVLNSGSLNVLISPVFSVNNRHYDFASQDTIIRV